MMSSFAKPIDIADVCAALEALPPGPRFLRDQQLRQMLPSVRKARANKTPWPAILAELGRKGIKTSVKRLKDLTAEPEAVIQRRISPGINLEADQNLSALTANETSEGGEL